MKKILLSFLFTCLLGIQGNYAADPVPAKYVMLMPRDKYESLTIDEKWAVQWFTDNHSGDGQVIYAYNIKNHILNPAINKVVWVHFNGIGNDVEAVRQRVDAKLGADAINAVAEYVKAGGNLYASKYASELIYKIGRVPAKYEPNLYSGSEPDRQGVNPQIGVSANLYDHQHHPIFKDLVMGVCTDGGAQHVWSRFVDGAGWVGSALMWDFNTIDGLEDNPNKLIDFEVKTNSIVLGAWEHVTDYSCAGLIEFLPLVNKSGIDDYKGRVIINSLGSDDWSSEHEDFNLEKMTENILQYLGTPKLRKVAYLLPDNLPDGFSKGDALASVDQDDERTALNWFYEELVEKGKGVVLRPQDLADLDPTTITTMWVNIDRDAVEGAIPNENGQLGQKGEQLSDLDHTNIYQLISRYVKNGGNLLLTKQAVQLVKSGDRALLGRSDTAPNMITILPEDGKTNKDAWAINAVIGAGYVPNPTDKYLGYNAQREDDPAETPGASGLECDFLTKNNNKYISYYWFSDGHYLPYQTADKNPAHTRTTDQIFDHRSNHLYYKLNANNEDYPIISFKDGDTAGPANAAAYGKYKYQVYLIEAGSDKGTESFKEDHNTIWTWDNGEDPQGFNNKVLEFQTNNNCDVLGQWGHKSGLDNAAIVDFKPTGAWDTNAWEGHILCIGLGAYEWQPSNTDGTAKEGENAFIGEIKQLTLNALNVLENDMDDSDSKTFTVGGVTYYGTHTTAMNYATIIEADPDLQAYDLTQSNGHIGYGQIKDPATGGYTYDITGIGIGAFTDCQSLAYADLTDWKYKTMMPENVRNLFPAWTLIYLPQETAATSLATCPIKGENIVNTLVDGTKVSEKLKLYDNEKGAKTGTAGWVYHLFANKYEFTANAVEFNRDFQKVKTTICLPFAITADEATDFGQFYVLDKVVGDDIRFATVPATEAFKPYVFEPIDDNIKILINAEKVIGKLDATPAFVTATEKYVLTPSLPQPWYVYTSNTGGNLIGEFRPVEFRKDNGDNIYAYMPDGSFKSGVVWADPFRAYMQLNGAPSGKSYIAVFDDFTPTGISQLNNNDEATNDGTYYTLQGVKVMNPGPGIYIRNNKKVIVRNK